MNRLTALIKRKEEDTEIKIPDNINIFIDRNIITSSDDNKFIYLQKLKKCNHSISPATRKLSFDLQGQTKKDAGIPDKTLAEAFIRGIHSWNKKFIDNNNIYLLFMEDILVKYKTSLMAFNKFITAYIKDNIIETIKYEKLRGNNIKLPDYICIIQSINNYGDKEYNNPGHYISCFVDMKEKTEPRIIMFDAAGVSTGYEKTYGKILSCNRTNKKYFGQVKKILHNQKRLCANKRYKAGKVFKRHSTIMGINTDIALYNIAKTLYIELNKYFKSSYVKCINEPLYNTFDIQPSHSQLCGLYCILFQLDLLVAKHNKFPLEKAIDNVKNMDTHHIEHLRYMMFKNPKSWYNKLYCYKCRDKYKKTIKNIIKTQADNINKIYKFISIYYRKRLNK